MRLYPVTFGHNSFAFNAHLNADGSPNQANMDSAVVIRRRRTEPAFREGRDAYHIGTGGVLGRAHKGLSVIRLWGDIIVPNASHLASLSDKERALRAAFDPELCYRDSPSTDGAYALDFSEPTTDTTTYPTARIPLRYWCRPMSQPSIEESHENVIVLPWALGLIAPDPRCYEQTEQTAAMSLIGNPVNVVNRGTSPAPIKLTIVMSGAGATNFTLTRGGVSFVLNLSTATVGQTIVVVMETCAPYGQGKRITKAGVDVFSLKTSGPSTWLDAPVGTTPFTLTNSTGITSATVAWYSARA
jgi:hypothetical protein